MGLVDTYTKYGYMQAHNKDMHDEEDISPDDMRYGKSSLWTCQIGLGKSFCESNMHHHIYHFANST